MSRAEYATVRLSRAQLQAIYEKLYPDYRAELLLSGIEGQKASPLALAFVKVAEAWSGIDDERSIRFPLPSSHGPMTEPNARPAPVPTPDGAAVPTHRAGHE